MAKILQNLNIGDNLRTHRKVRGLTQGDVCAQTAQFGRPVLQSTYGKMENRDHTKRLLKFIKTYNGLWQLICTPSNDDVEMDMKKMKMLIEKLHKESLDEIIVVLLTVHRKERYVESLIEHLTLKMGN